jgi:hypothetical protein
VVPATHEIAQRPSVHTCPAVQRLPHAPQLARSVSMSRQTPVQLVRPVAHDTTHMPREHTWPAAQAIPQAPQLARSLWRSRQVPMQ